MKNKNILLCGVFFLMTMTSCRKDIPPPSPDSNAVFEFTGDVNGVSKNFVAGENDYYMYCNVSQNSDNVNVFDSHLKKYECTSCAEDLEIIINDYQVSGASDPIVFSNSLPIGYYPYQIPGGAPKSFDVTFNVVTNPAAATSYFWDFGDGSTQTAAPGSMTHTYNNPGKYEACLTVTFPSSATSTICQEVKIEIPDNACKFNYTQTATAGTIVNFTSNMVLGTGPFTFSWDFGDGNTSNLANPSHTYAASGSYLVCQTVTDANGAVSKFCKNVNTFGTLVPIANMDAVSSVPLANPLALSNVVVNYTDASGLVWTTNNSAGQSSAFFNIISSEDFETNEIGLPTKKVTVQFKCTAYNGSNSVLLNNCSAVFAFAYHN